VNRSSSSGLWVASTDGSWQLVPSWLMPAPHRDRQFFLLVSRLSNGASYREEYEVKERSKPKQQECANYPVRLGCPTYLADLSSSANNPAEAPPYLCRVPQVRVPPKMIAQANAIGSDRKRPTRKSLLRWNKILGTASG
jgi:hypothetical protein